MIMASAAPRAPLFIRPEIRWSVIGVGAVKATGRNSVMPATAAPMKAVVASIVSPILRTVVEDTCVHRAKLAIAIYSLMHIESAKMPRIPVYQKLSNGR
ncbi:hypothetical protein AB0H00_02775 [Nocardia sp. NPDC023852]|uniref:hypothetical protein n=1 Tax=Nocardia sp. NPDC023852 TaxID=3154697 RepID=UPI00340C66A4